MFQTRWHSSQRKRRSHTLVNRMTSISKQLPMQMGPKQLLITRRRAYTSQNRRASEHHPVKTKCDSATWCTTAREVDVFCVKNHFIRSADVCFGFHENWYHTASCPPNCSHRNTTKGAGIIYIYIYIYMYVCVYIYIYNYLTPCFVQVL